jgi:hypothetical protein
VLCQWVKGLKERLLARDGVWRGSVCLEGGGRVHARQVFDIGSALRVCMKMARGKRTRTQELSFTAKHG